MPKVSEYIGCSGEVKGKDIVLSPLEAYSFCGWVVKKEMINIGEPDVP